MRSLDSKYYLKDSSKFAPSDQRSFVATTVRSKKDGERGLFAAEDIAKGQIIGIDGGAVVSSVEDVPPNLRYAVLIDHNLYLAPSDYDNLGSFWFFNHSCSSNVGRIGTLVFVAKNNIKNGDELTLDYAPLIAGVANWNMTCHCGSSNCRTSISANDWTIPEIARALWQEWLPHIQKEIILRKVFS